MEINSGAKKASVKEVMDLLCELSQQLLNWRWEGVDG
jgi:hypothetical protein